MNSIMRYRRLLKRAAVFWGILFIFSSYSVSANPNVADETCLNCHDDYETTLASGPHQLSSKTDGAAITIACANCHAGGEVHADDPSVENITNPANSDAFDADKTCSACHQAHLQWGNDGFDQHAGTQMTCMSCHSVHGSTKNLVLLDDAKFCGKCHVNVSSQFMNRSNHPKKDGNVSCIGCHDISGKNEPNFGFGSGANCYSCHPELSGPYLYEHEVTSSFSTEGGEGCVSCHDPHGSPNDRLLREPINNLCQQCHGVPPLHRTAHQGQYASVDCFECHSEVHGSYDNHGLLDPNLGTRLSGAPEACYCHNVGD